jgi:hypothetical protein
MASYGNRRRQLVLKRVPHSHTPPEVDDLGGRFQALDYWHGANTTADRYGIGFVPEWFELMFFQLWGDERTERAWMRVHRVPLAVVREATKLASEWRKISDAA